MELMTLILAAGKGTRMRSFIPKVIHKVNGMPMILKILNSVEVLGSQQNIVVLGHMKEEVIKVIQNEKNIKYVIQEEQLGTGHAVLQAKELLEGHDGDVIVLCGDTPLLKSSTLQKLYDHHRSTGAVTTVMTAYYDEPYGYGRIVKENGNIKAIIEEKDADENIKKIKEVNAGVYCFKIKDLFEALNKITNNNKNGEYYLPDVISIQVNEKKQVKDFILEESDEIMGINSKVELAAASKKLRLEKNKKLMENGTIIIDPDNTYIEENVKIGKDTVIYPGVVLQGNTIIGDNCEIIGNTRIIDSEIHNNVRIESSVVEESIVEDFVTMGPFAHLRPKSHLKEKVHIGNFVETKKSVLEKGVKAGHLTYLGDAHVGEDTNIGAGTITCNYDGKNKFKTEIGAGSFIGSDSMLVAPVNIGSNALIGAGSVITKDVPSDALAVSRSKQIVKLDWRKR